MSVAPTVTDNPQTEVRTCGRCGQPAVVCLHAWKHSVQGAATGRVTRECVCQSCGAQVTLYDPRAIRVQRIVGYLFFWAVIPTLIMLVSASRRSAAWARHPLVPGARYPEIKFRTGPGPRRCGRCGDVAKLLAVTRHRHNGIPTGTDCKYKCGKCGAAFTTESAGGLAFSFFGGALLGGGGLALLASAQSPGMRFGGGGFGLVGGGFLIYQAASRIAAALRNPPI